MKQIELTNGFTAIVDDEDYERASQYNWSYSKKPVVIQTSITRQGKSTSITLPRFLLGIDDPRIRCAYVNGDVLDNRKSNLKRMTQAEIVAKTGKYSTATSSKYKGVSWEKRRGKWGARIHYRGKNFHLGYFDSEVQAARVYDAAAQELRGKAAYLNFPDQVKSPPQHTFVPKKAGVRKRKGTPTTSQFIGVYHKPSENCWRCQFKHNGKRFRSSHKSEAEAAYAYDKLAIEYRGVDAILNFPDHWRRQRQRFE